LVRLKGFQKLTPVDDSLQTFFRAVKVKPLKRVVVPLSSALGRVTAENIIAQVDVPRLDRSAVDGYALKSEETAGATQFKPRIFQLTKKNKVDAWKTEQVWTGNPIPIGADAVVMLENTSRLEHKILVWNQVTPGENVSKRGEDIRNGEVAVEAGIRLRPQHLGLMAALGTSEVKVFDKPRVGILSTGNELVELGEQPRENQVFNVNRFTITGLCLELGVQPQDLGIARDEVDEISRKLKLGLEKSDVVITSGGTSVGCSDLVPEAIDEIGKPGVIVHGIAMRPAMPTALAAVSGKPILILPGNPVAAMIGFEVFGRPLLCRMLGLKHVEPRSAVQAKMTRGIATTLGRKNFVRVHVFQRGSQLLAEPISARGSSMLSTMTKANGYVIATENREGLLEGELVSIQLFDSVVADEDCSDSF
jgi:molybdopterin molybdotransferase